MTREIFDSGEVNFGAAVRRKLNANFLELYSGEEAGSQALHVGAGRAYTTVQAAIDSILDSAADKPYIIYIDPGEYAPFNMSTKDYINVIGSGDSTIINVTVGLTQSLRVGGSYNSLQNLQVIWSDNGTSLGTENYAVRGAATTRELVLRNLTIRVPMTNASRTARVWCIGGGANYGTDTFGMRIEDCQLFTESCGILPAVLQCWIKGCHIQLLNPQEPTGGDHIGLCDGYNTRIDVSDCIIRTGYGYDDITDDGANVYAILMRGVGDNQRMNLRDIEGIIRSDGTGGECVYVKWLDVGGTNSTFVEIRIYDCRLRAEGDNVTLLKTIDTPHIPGVADWGKTFIIGIPAFSKETENGIVYGTPMELDDTSDGATIPNRGFQLGGQFIVDTSAAATELIIPQVAGRISGVATFVNKFGSANNLTLTGAFGVTFCTLAAGTGQASVTITPGTSKSFVCGNTEVIEI